MMAVSHLFLLYLGLMLGSLPTSLAGNYVTNVYKYTGCVGTCGNSRCPSGHRIYSGTWYQLGITDSYGKCQSGSRMETFWI